MGVARHQVREEAEKLRQSLLCQSLSGEVQALERESCYKEVRSSIWLVAMIHGPEEEALRV